MNTSIPIHCRLHGSSLAVHAHIPIARRQEETCICGAGRFIRAVEVGGPPAWLLLVPEAGVLVVHTHGDLLLRAYTVCTSFPAPHCMCCRLYWLGFPPDLSTSESVEEFQGGCQLYEGPPQTVCKKQGGRGMHVKLCSGWQTHLNGGVNMCIYRLHPELFLD